MMPAGTVPPSAEGGLAYDVRVTRRSLVVQMAAALPPGRCLAVVGPSGAGKSTVVAAIAGLVPLEAGYVSLAGRCLSSGGGRRGRVVPLHQRAVGLVAQQPALFPHLSAAANIGYGLPGGAAEPAVAALAEALELTPLLGERPARLSGGQRQRVALARALAPAPAALLLDEPYTALDPALRDRVAASVAAAVAAAGVACLLITHDLAEAQRWGDEVAVLADGRCLQQAAADTLVGAPADLQVAGLVGYRAVVGPDACRPLGAAAAPAGTRALGVHPGAVVLDSDPITAATATAGGAAGAGSAAGALRRRLPGATVEVPVLVTGVRASGARWVAACTLPAGARDLSLEPGLGAGHDRRAVVEVPVPAGVAVPEPGASRCLGLVAPPCFDAQGRLLGQWRSGGTR